MDLALCQETLHLPVPGQETLHLHGRLSRDHPLHWSLVRRLSTSLALGHDTLPIPGHFSGDPSHPWPLVRGRSTTQTLGNWALHDPCPWPGDPPPPWLLVRTPSTSQVLGHETLHLPGCWSGDPPSPWPLVRRPSTSLDLGQKTLYHCVLSNNTQSCPDCLPGQASNPLGKHCRLDPASHSLPETSHHTTKATSWFQTAEGFILSLCLMFSPSSASFP